jgi:hypothetical protein
MKKLSDIKQMLSTSELLNNTNLSFIKGGVASTTADDKRRERPGGGISTL